MRTLYIDIETAPMVNHNWGLWNQNIGLSQMIEDPRVICFAAKFRGEKEVMFSSEWGQGREGMLEEAHGLLAEADIVAHFNGERFDAPWLNGEFYRLGWGPPAPYRQLDFLKVIKKNFRFPSNKLEYVSRISDIGGKLQHEGHKLWVKCMEGDPRAQAKMERYNRQDTILLEKLHTRLLPWITNHPSLGLFSETGEEACPRCGSKDLRKEGYRYTNVGKYQRYQCRSCAGWCASGKRVEGVDLRGVA